jgi:predicted SprT family Zn-dependent metalloprotease
VRRLALFTVAFACLAVILGGAEHAASREQFQQVDLQRLYHEVNRESFAGKLPDVPVRWGDLTKDDAYGVTHFEKGVPYAIEVDRQSVKTESFARDVLRHESCHIATIGEAKRRNEDRHGALFVECMARIQSDDKATEAD